MPSRRVEPPSARQSVGAIAPAWPSGASAAGRPVSSRAPTQDQLRRVGVVAERVGGAERRRPRSARDPVPRPFRPAPRCVRRATARSSLDGPRSDGTFQSHAHHLLEGLLARQPRRGAAPIAAARSSSSTWARLVSSTMSGVPVDLEFAHGRSRRRAGRPTASPRERLDLERIRRTTPRRLVRATAALVTRTRTEIPA